MYVKASPGLVCRDPDLLDLLPPEGRDVPDTPYWQRRLRDNDVELCKPPTPTKGDEQSNSKPASAGFSLATSEGKK